ncbi:MAG: glycosyltransferase family 87 protein, partial [Legionellales bacterium]
MEELKDGYRKFSSLSLVTKILFLVLVIVLVIYFISASRKGGDFASYLEAAGKMLHGTNIYDPPYVHLRYSYSPFWAMVLTPLALLPLSVGVFIWLVINVFFLWRTIFLLRHYFEIKFADRKMDMILWFVVIVYMSRFIELNFHHSQMTIFLLWCILEGLRLSDNRAEIGAGILVGLGSIIKVMPIVMIPYFIYRRKFKAAISSVFTILIAFFLPILVVGHSRFWELNKTWLQILRPDSSEFQIDAVWSFPQNLSALLYRV